MNEWVWSIVGMVLTGNTKFLQKNLSQCHFVYHKSNIHLPGIETCNLSHGMVTSYYRMTMTTTTTTGKLSYWHEINLQRNDNYCTNFIPVPTNVNKTKVLAAMQRMYLGHEACSVVLHCILDKRSEAYHKW